MDTEDTETDHPIEGTLQSLGTTLRLLRRRRGFTLDQLAKQTGLSTSMLSMVERGRASPSIGSLVALASVLGVHMSALFQRNGAPTDPVSRYSDQVIVESPEGVTRRLAVVDNELDVEVVVNEYPSGTASASRVLHHPGHEYGIVLKGSLTVDFEGSSYQLGPGDSIGYSSESPHRIRNQGRAPATAIWINLGPR